MAEKLLTLMQAAKELGVSPQTIRRADAAGKIRIVRTPGGRRRVPQSEVDRLLGKKSSKK